MRALVSSLWWEGAFVSSLRASAVFGSSLGASGVLGSGLGASGVLGSSLRASGAFRGGLPELQLGGGGVQRVLQLRLQRLQLLSQVPAVLLRLGAGLPLQLQVLLQLRDLRLQLSDILLGQVLG